MSSEPVPIVRVDIESIRLYLATSVAQLRSRVSIDTIRPLPVFLGLNSGNDISVSPKAFSSPSTTLDVSCPLRIWRRVQLNFSFFLSNYALVAFMTSIVVALMHPVMLLILSIVYSLWWMHGFLIRHEVVVFGTSIQNLMTVQQRFYVLFIFTSVVIVHECLVPFAIFLGISTLIIMTHALLRDATQLDDFDAGGVGFQKQVEDTNEKDRLLQGKI